MWSEWSTAQIALVTSGISILLAFLNLGWNVWSKFIFPKARMLVTVEIDNGSADWPDLGVRSPIFMEIANLGPTDCVLRGVCFPTSTRSDSRKKYWLDRSSRLMVEGGKALSDDADWPRLVKAGEIVVVVITRDLLSSEPLKKPVSVGFLDTFDRYHLVKPSVFQRILTELGTGQ